MLPSFMQFSTPTRKPFVRTAIVVIINFYVITQPHCNFLFLLTVNRLEFSRPLRARAGGFLLYCPRRVVNVGHQFDDSPSRRYAAVEVLSGLLFVTFQFLFIRKTKIQDQNYAKIES